MAALSIHLITLRRLCSFIDQRSKLCFEDIFSNARAVANILNMQLSPLKYENGTRKRLQSRNNFKRNIGGEKSKYDKHSRGTYSRYLKAFRKNGENNGTV